jgi:hypothetical protein
MSERVVIDYLRARGRVEPPPGFVRSVMGAIDEAPPARSWFSAFLPAAAVAGAVAIIALTALLLGQNPNIGPGPTESAAASPSAISATLDDLRQAVANSTEVLRSQEGVEGVGTSYVFDEVGGASWFSWRSNGDQVVVNRSDPDVTESGWWLNSGAEPPARGARVETQIQVITEGGYYFTRREIGGADEWISGLQDGSPDVLGIPFPAALDGQVDAWQGVFVLTLEGDASVRSLRDGGEEWILTRQFREGSLVQTFGIGPDGALRSIAQQLVDVAPTPDERPITSSIIELTILEDPEPIPLPDVDLPPDPVAFGMPDLPLPDGPQAARIDYREYVEVALDALETYHWNAANVDWAGARSAALDGLPDEPTAGQAHQRIIAAIQTFDTFNTVFVRPGDIPPPDAAAGPGDLPVGDRIGEIAIVTLPASIGSDAQAVQQYLVAARDQMAAADAPDPACGWIVDVRAAAGGASGPLFAAVGGLLGEGRAITFDSAVSDWWVDVDASGTVSFGAEQVTSEILDSPIFSEATADAEREQAAWEAAIARERPYRPAAGDLPVVVLTSSATLSAGEQLVVAFQGRSDTRTIGGVTGGGPQSLLALHMVDGAVLRMPTATPIDRDGTRYSENIFPDDSAPAGDAALDAAVEWLETHYGCS